MALLFGRFGNYINGELLGLPGYTGPLAILRDGESYFPTPLLEACLEGVVLFLWLRWFWSRSPRPGQTGALFLIGYGLLRSVAEFFRTPDVQIGYLAFDWLTLGHVLSSVMIVAGGVLFIRFARRTSG